jgi:hypothetical protein
MRNTAAALLSLLSTPVMAGTFVYTPVHVAPVIHINPGFHAAPMVRPGVSAVRPAATVVKPVAVIARSGHLHAGHHGEKTVPVTVYNVSQNAPQAKKCTQSKPDDATCARK